MTRPQMLDFTSALYLGLRHPTRSLRPWDQLTTGAPAALFTHESVRRLERSLAALTGCERAVIAPSTLHLFWDLFGILATARISIYVDSGVYAIARWGIERARARQVRARDFQHYDPSALTRLLRSDRSPGHTPLVVVDGFCPACGRPAPLAAYLDCVRRFGGLLMIDDTQALGILGASPGPDAPYGRGGGGSLIFNRIAGPDVVAVSSLAKGLGVPVAVLAASGQLVRRFENESETRVHTSPPSAALVHAAEHALEVNAERGDVLRMRLAGLVRRFGSGVAYSGLSAGGMFPVQAIESPRGVDAVTLHEQLLAAGIRALLQRSRHDENVRVSFMITARHSAQDIARAIHALASAVSSQPLRVNEPRLTRRR